MTAGSRRDDEHQPGDAFDRAIDETLGAAMHAHAVDLRERVLSRLDEPASTIDSPRDTTVVCGCRCAAASLSAVQPQANCPDLASAQRPNAI